MKRACGLSGPPRSGGPDGLYVRYRRRDVLPPQAFARRVFRWSPVSRWAARPIAFLLSTVSRREVRPFRRQLRFRRRAQPVLRESPAYSGCPGHRVAKGIVEAFCRGRFSYRRPRPAPGLGAVRDSQADSTSQSFVTSDKSSWALSDHRHCSRARDTQTHSQCHTQPGKPNANCTGLRRSNTMVLLT